MSGRMLGILWMVLAGPVGAADYLEIVPVFWQSLYPKGGESLYCGTRFAPNDRQFNIEHVFPRSWIRRDLACGTTEQCRRDSPRYNEVISDMHNLYPAERQVNKARGSMAFGEVSGERWYKPGCDFEIDKRKGRVEPRPEVRGNVARAMLYMSERYSLTLFRRQRELLERWHLADPPDDQERARNRVILKVQGQANSWIEKAAD